MQVMGFSPRFPVVFVSLSFSRCLVLSPTKLEGDHRAIAASTPSTYPPHNNVQRFEAKYSNVWTQDERQEWIEDKFTEAYPSKKKMSKR